MGRPLIAAGLLAVGLLIYPGAPAQVPDLEALERQLAAEAQRRAREASMARLVVEADVPCDLRIDGEAKGRVVPGEPRIVLVVGGEQLIECASVEFPSARVRHVRQAAPASKLVVGLSLSESVAAARRKAETSARRASLESRFERVADGFLDKDHGVIWAGADNGRDTNWANAAAYCEALGSGWSLPSVTQLQSLYDASGTFARSVQGIAIKPAIAQLGPTGVWYWSAEANGSTEAWYVHLGDGDRRSTLQSSDGNLSRALCVHRP